MARIHPEPTRPDTVRARTAVLLVNLGTPAQPTPEAVRPYLKEFLSDPRVVEIPRLVWWPILNGIILNTRPKQSAEKYRKVWMPEGSPLQVHTERQSKLLAGYLSAADHTNVRVAWAMRYGQPSIASVLAQLRAEGCERIVVLPLYPQYAASTTATVVDEVARCLLSWRNQPAIRFVRDFHQDAGYIAALAQQVRDHWMKNGVGELLLLSYHGIPKRSYDLGDPYADECHRTAQLLAAQLQLPPERVKVTFQSRFGRAEWLQPYTQPTLEKLAQQGLKRVDVMCPGFVSDCLETLEEINMECREAFLGSGGQQFEYIPCLNESDAWIQALRALALQHLGNWLND
jgi:ferrochelatase